MVNPVLVEVTRGALTESRHRGMIAVTDSAGSVVYSAGDIDAVVFPRSACKAIQALPLVESGAADAYGFGNREIALAASSHSGEDAHAALAADMLARAGRGVADLECGAHWSFQQPVLIHQARTRDFLTHCATIVRESMPALSVPAAIRTSIRRATPATITRFRCRSGKRWRTSPVPLSEPMSAARMAAIFRPTLCR
nr:asparaginase [Marinicella sp. W31]MDC2877994.1 asparaginase [Marinicella sp. W31]